MSDQRAHDLKALWKGQESGNLPVSMDVILARARISQRRFRRVYVTVMLIAVACGVYFVWCALHAPNNLVRVGSVIELTFVPWCAWRMRHRWPASAPTHGGSAAAIVSFHRDQILRQQRTFRSTMLLVAPVFAGAAVQVAGYLPRGMVASSRLLVNWLPVLALLALWFLVVSVQLRRNHRRLQNQINELDGMKG